MDSEESRDGDSTAGGDNPRSPSPPSPRSPASPRSPRSPRSPDGGPSSPDEPEPKKWISKGAAKADPGPRSSSASVSSKSEDEPEPEPPTEEISEGEMDFDEDKSGRAPKEEGQRKKRPADDHEDLSDVSDSESTGPVSEDDGRPNAKNRTPKIAETKTDAKLNGAAKVDGDVPPNPVNGSLSAESPNQDKIIKPDDTEEQLDFEAEEGECIENQPSAKPSSIEEKHKNADKKDDEGSGEASSLEEGEVSDDEERRPEETEPRPVCRFYSRGQCTWGISCRFLHPGVTDKGNYTMFDMVRSMPAGYGQHPTHSAAMSLHSQSLYMGRPDVPSSESAWERGLRTAKEMLRKACKRKEQDTDFEEKKLHLSLGGGGVGSLGPGDEEDADLAAYAGYPPPESPPPIVKRERDDLLRMSDRHYDDARLYSSRERARYIDRISHLSPSPPPHRGLPLYDDKLDDRGLAKSRRPRTTREVIVQRVPGSGRGDEWADPWMRGGSGAVSGNRSPVGKRRSTEKSTRRRGRRKYSSGSSYTSSSSSRSSSRSSNSSGSVGRKSRRKRRSPIKSRPRGASPTVIVQERRAATARAVAMNPPAPSARKRLSSPAATRQGAANPPPPHHTKTIIDEFGRTKPVKAKTKDRKPYSKSSSSDSSSSSSDSESESHSSSSSDGSRTRKGKSSAPAVRTLGGLDKKPPPAKPAGGTSLLTPKYLTDALSQRKVENEPRKADSTVKKRAAVSPVNEPAPAKKPASRREELLKQLKAVEDAIARKRSKV